MAQKFRDADERIKKRRQILKSPIVPLPDAPDNLHISKADFIAKRRKEKEDALKVSEFKESLKTKKGATDGLQGEEEGSEEVKRKIGRPKKVDE